MYRTRVPFFPHIRVIYIMWQTPDDVCEMVRRYGLSENVEYIIIPFRASDGRMKRFFILKRPFIRIVDPYGNFEDYPLAQAVEATVKYPELPLSTALRLLPGKTLSDDGKENAKSETEGHEKENTHQCNLS